MSILHESTHHYELTLFVDDKKVKTYYIPKSDLAIEDIKKRQIESMSGEVIDPGTDYYKFIIQTDGYTETVESERYE